MPLYTIGIVAHLIMKRTGLRALSVTCHWSNWSMGYNGIKMGYEHHQPQVDGVDSQFVACNKYMTIKDSRNPEGMNHQPSEVSNIAHLGP